MYYHIDLYFESVSIEKFEGIYLFSTGSIKQFLPSLSLSSNIRDGSGGPAIEEVIGKGKIWVDRIQCAIEFVRSPQLRIS